MVKPGLPYLDMLADLSSRYRAALGRVRSQRRIRRHRAAGRTGTGQSRQRAPRGLDRIRARRRQHDHQLWRAPRARVAVGLSRSDELFERARLVSPGGVHSPVRAFKGVGGTPRFMTGGHGACITRHRRSRPHRFLHGLRAADTRARQRAGARRGRGGHPSRLEPGHCRALFAGAGRVHHQAHSLGAERALREFGHRSGDVGAARGARRHRARQDPEVRWLLSRPHRCHADPLRLGPCGSHRARQRRPGPRHAGRHGGRAAER